MRRATIFLLLAAGLSGCFAPVGDLSDEMPEDLPAGSCEDTDTDACASSSGTSGAGASSGGSSSTTAPVVDDCEATGSCLGGDACVAEWDAQAESRGPFVCRFACVPLLDEASWCLDDAACCDASAQCTARGYCIVPESADDESGSSTGGSTG